MYQVVIVGAGPVGLMTALELTRHGISASDVLVLDAKSGPVQVGSRAIILGRMTLDLLEKNGLDRLVFPAGVTVNGRSTYLGEMHLFTKLLGAMSTVDQVPKMVKEGDLPPNLSIPQYQVEQILLAEVLQRGIKVRWNSKVTGLNQDEDSVMLQMETGESVTAEYVVACDGARSTMRKLCDIDFPGFTGKSKFLIVDAQMDLGSSLKAEFYFDHPSHLGGTFLVVPQPNGIRRLDWQLGADADENEELSPESIGRRIRLAFGDKPCQVIWKSIYSFHQRLAERFQHGRVFLAGDAAHLVSPFGAHGLNSGIMDAQNIAWKLAAVLNGSVPEAILDTYHQERWEAGRWDQEVTSKVMRFISPETVMARLRRNAILRASKHFKGMRRLVKSGEGLRSFTYSPASSSIIELDKDEWSGSVALGARVPDLPCEIFSDGGWQPTRLRHLIGNGFAVISFGQSGEFPRIQTLPIEVFVVTNSQMPEQQSSIRCLNDASGELARALGAEEGSVFIIRPDGHIALRRKSFEPEQLPMFLAQCC